tara:strand:+ start:5644 stop:6822 length:1179 start_codon:yes stop_codon:yes gene_type:complete
MKKIKDIRNEINEGSTEEFIESTEAGIRNKAEETGISYEILKQVFDRGLAAWKSSHRPGTTAVQWAYARINSFATGGKTQSTADADLWKKHKGIKEAKNMYDAPAHFKKGDKVYITTFYRGEVSIDFAGHIVAFVGKDQIKIKGTGKYSGKTVTEYGENVTTVEYPGANESTEVEEAASWKTKYTRLSADAKIKRIGFTKISEDDKILEISHGGNQGNTIERSIDPNIKKAGLPTVAKLKEKFTNYYENGSPSYEWVIQFKKPKNGEYMLEDIEEAMSRAARIKRGKIMKRMAPKLQKAKERASKKKASSEVIDKRAVKQAKDVLIKKWLKGKDKGDVAFAERERIEAKLKKSGNAINRIKKKFVKVIRKQEAEKLTNKEESVELEEPNHTN